MNKIAVFLSCLVLALFLALFSAALFQPVYSDEVAWLQINARALQDGLRMNHYMFQCSSHRLWDIPWGLAPGRVLSSWLHPATPMQMRLWGGGYYLCLIGLLAILMRDMLRVRWLYAVAGAAALMSFGVLPYAMVSVRPESVMAVGLMLLYVAKHKGKALHPLLYSLLVLLFCSWFLSIHPKAILFVPALLAMAFCLPVGRAVRAVWLACIAAMAWQAYAMWQPFLSCPEVPSHNQAQLSHGAQLMAVFDAPLAYLWQFLAHLGSVPSNYILPNLFVPSYLYRGNWMPPQMFPGGLSAMMNLGIVIVIAAILVLAVAGAVAAFRRAGSDLCIAGLLAAALLLVMGNKTEGTGYEAPLVWPVFLLICLLCVKQLHEKASREGYYAFMALLLVSVASQAMLIAYTAPYVRSNLQIHTDNGQVARQGYTQSVLGYGYREERIREAARLCHIDAASRNVLVDDITYLALQNTVTPLNAMSYHRPIDRSGLRYLQAVQSSGAVMRCDRFSPELRGLLREKDGICCMDRESIQALP